MAPHIAEEMWQRCGQTGSVFKASWPDYNPAAIEFDLIKIAVQINGKLRGEIEIAKDSTQNQVFDKAIKADRILPYMNGRQIIKKIYIPGRLVNLVVK